MFRNYLMTALRNLARHKLYSFINIAGLAVGLACVLFIALFVRYELSYDKWIDGSEHLYRVEVDFYPPGRPIIHSANSQYMLPAAMLDEIPEVRAMTRLGDQRITMTAGNRQFLQQVSVVEPDFLRVIKLPLVSGDPATVLRQPQSIVLSQSVARKFFGAADPIGKIITVGRGDCEQNDAACNSAQVPLTVTGVMRDLPGNTQLVAEALMPNTSIADRVTKQGKQNWLGSSTYNYVQLLPGADPAAVVAKTIPIMDRHVDLSQLANVKARGSDIAKVRLVPFRDAHLSTDRYGAMTPPGSWTILYGMTVVGMLILLTACINYMNLATARATLRAREISLRKCMGATRGQLVAQFLGESVLMTLVALILALAAVEALLPAFGHLVERPITFHYLQDWPVALAMLGLALVAGLLSGIYPALVLSGFRPAATLRANAGGPGGSGALRTALVVLQFAVSIGLGISAVVIFSQIQYARALDLGFQHGNIVIVDGSRLSLEGRDSFEHALAAGPGIAGVARSNTLPFTGFTDATGLQVPGNPQLFTPNRDVVSPEFFALYKIKLLAGRMLSRQRSADVFQDIYQTGKVDRNNGRNILVSAMTARQLGFGTQGAIGKTVIMGRDRVKIVGVVSDVLFRGATSEVLPRVYVYAGEAAGVFSVRVSGDMPAALAYIDRTWHSFLPNLFNSRSLLDDKFARLYAADQRQGKIFGIFVAIAIFIAGLGLFGLAAFTAGRRTREIGVRKVFGARTRDVTFLLLWQFSIPVLVANLIAWPLAWYYLNGWLQGFAYRITLNPLYFVGVGFAALLIAWATIFAHAHRVARANPINALRYE